MSSTNPVSATVREREFIDVGDYSTVCNNICPNVTVHHFFPGNSEPSYAKNSEVAINGVLIPAVLCIHPDATPPNLDAQTTASAITRPCRVCLAKNNFRLNTEAMNVHIKPVNTVPGIITSEG